MIISKATDPRNPKMFICFILETYSEDECNFASERKEGPSTHMNQSTTVASQAPEQKLALIIIELILG